MGNLKDDRKATGWAARDPSAHLSPYTFTLSTRIGRKTRAEDVLIKVICCSICHTDYHNIKNDLGSSNYPMFLGHEVVGQVVEVGLDVSKFKVGDTVGVGFLVGCCNSCHPCEAGSEQYCNNKILTYNNVYTDGEPTQGGFADSMVVHQKFVVKIPEGMPPEQAAPLLCSGVTIYSPLSHFGLKKSGLRGGIVGLGGVTIISSSDKKKDETMMVLGVDDYFISSNADSINQTLADSLDYVIDTILVSHHLDDYLSMFKFDGRLILLGVANTPLEFLSPLLMTGRKMITGMLIGSMKETKEVLEFCKEKNVKSMIEVVKMEHINTAMERLAKNDVRYRFVVDVAGSKLEDG